MEAFVLDAILRLNSSEYDKGLNNALNSGSKLGGALKTAFSVGAAAITAATTAVTGFAAASVKVGMGFDSSMSQVAATMGFTVEELNTEGSEAAQTFQTLSDFAQQMGSTTAFSASQAADALNYMALAGYDAETSINMLPNVLNLAAAGNIELAAASDMVTDASSALGLSIEETVELVDKMAKASSKSNTSVAQLGEAILTVGGTAKNLKGGTTELATALGILADNGVKGAEGGTALRNILLNLSPKSEAAAGAMEELGFAAYDANGEMRSLNDIFTDMASVLDSYSTQDRQRVLSNIFNKVDLKSVNAMLAASGDELGAIATALDQTAVAWDDYAMAAGEGFEGIDVINDISGFLQSMTKNGVEAAQQIEVLQSEFGLTAEDAKAAFDAANEAIEGHTNRWEELSGYIDDAQGAAQAMAETQLDNLQGDITLFKSALEGAQIAISNELTPSLREFVQFGAESISNLTEAFKTDGVDGAMEALGTILSDGMAMITAHLPDAIEAGLGLLQALMQGISDNLDLLIDAATQVTMSLVQFLLDNLDSIIKTGLDILIALATGIAENLDELIPTIVSVVLQIVDTLTDPETLGNLVDAAIAIMIALTNGIIDALPRLIERAPEIVENLVTALVENAPKLLKASLEIIVSLVQGLFDNLPQVFEAGGKIVAEIIAGIGQAISGLWNAGKEAIQSVKDGFDNLNPLEWGKDLISNFVGGITSKWEDLKSSVRGVAQTVKDLLGFSEPKEGPLSDFHTYAPDMMKLFAEGIRDNEHLITDQIEKSFDFGDMTIGAVGSNETAPIESSYRSSRMALPETAFSSESFAEAIKAALSGAGVYMDGRKVGQLVTNYQAGRARVVGV